MTEPSSFTIKDSTVAAFAVATVSPAVSPPAAAANATESATASVLALSMSDLPVRLTASETPATITIVTAISGTMDALSVRLVVLGDPVS